MTDHCQAREMDVRAFGAPLADACPPCAEPARVLVGRHWLCRGCAEALKALVTIADKLQ